MKSLVFPIKISSVNNQYILARSRFLLPMTMKNGKLDRIQDGYILVSGNLDSGKIIEIGAYTESIGKRLIDKYGKTLKIIGISIESPTVDDIRQINGVILPGFVKGHGHDHEAILAGVEKDVPLTTWLDKAVNLFTGFLHENQDDLEENLGKSPYFIAYIKARLDDVSFGITTAVTHHCNFNKYHVDELVEANSVAGTKIIIAVGSQDRHYDDRILDTPEKAIERLNNYLEKHQEDKRSVIIPGPDQLFSNGPELLKSQKKWANDRNKLIHIHSSEEPETTKWFTDTYKMTPIQYANSIGFLDENTLLAHQVNNTKQDLEILSKTKAMVVHNPLANTILGSGMPPLIEMKKANIPFCISTDGSGSADNQNMLSAARLASQYQKAHHQDATLLKAEDMLKRITLKPAEMLGINAGVLEPEKDADFIIVDLSVPNLTPTRKETVVENLIWASAGNEIKHVVANGKILVEDYKFLTMDKDVVLADIQKLADLFEDYKQTAQQVSGTGVHKKS